MVTTEDDYFVFDGNPDLAAERENAARGCCWTWKILGSWCYLFIAGVDGVCHVYILFSVFVSVHYHVDPAHFATPWSAIHSSC